MNRVGIEELKNSHGVPLESLLSLVEPTEGIEEMEFATSKAHFRSDNKAATIHMSLIGTDREYKVSYEGYKKAMRTSGFPEAVINKYPADLMMEPLNWGFPEKIKNAKAFIKNDELVGFVKPSVDLTSTRRMLEIINEVSPDGVLFERLDHDLFFTNCSFIWPTKQSHWDDDRLPERGDILLAGANFQNSIMGEHPLEVSLYVYRLNCLNGMISKNNVFKWSRKTETVPILDWFKDKIITANQLADTEFAHIDKMRHTPVRADHLADLYTNIFAEYGISDRQRQLIMDVLVDNPPRNMWDIINAITGIANDSSLADNPQAIRHLQLIGGDIVARTSVCQTCFSVRRN